jgi:eukaryotic-like serine/threonine-protein kinase
MAPGDRIASRYVLERKLGEGGMGAVWSAVHAHTGRRHALKFLREASLDPAVRRRVLREARAASAVDHPNVVAVDDVIEAPDGSPVLVMDLLEGESLGERLARVSRLPVREAVRIVSEALLALEVAHEVGIVHRDLKPDNVFLARTPSGEAVKILDFGVAKLTATDGPARATNLLTESGAMMGTPCYMAPEQAFAEGEIDARADLWSIGAVLYECLSGTRPADGATLGQVLKVLATGAIVPLEQRVTGLPPELVGLVSRLLSTDREKRPASAREVREALARVVAGGGGDDDVQLRPGERPSAAATTGGAAVLGARASRGRSFAAGALGLLLVSAASAAAVWLASASPASPASAPAPPAETASPRVGEPESPTETALPRASASASEAERDEEASPSTAARISRPAPPVAPPPSRPGRPATKRLPSAPAPPPASGSKLLTEPPF